MSTESLSSSFYTPVNRMESPQKESFSSSSFLGVRSRLFFQPQTMLSFFVFAIFPRFKRFFRETSSCQVFLCLFPFVRFLLFF